MSARYGLVASARQLLSLSASCSGTLVHFRKYWKVDDLDQSQNASLAEMPTSRLQGGVLRS
jgi:hypothetical protein